MHIIKRLAAVAFAMAVVMYHADDSKAMPIVGTLELTGGILSETADEIEFANNGAVIVVGSSGDLSTLTFGTTGTINDITDFTVVPFSLYDVGGFNFTVSSYGARTPNNAGGFEFHADGTLTGVGFDPTPALLNFTSNSQGVTISFSSSTIAVPEPATLALLGVGIAGLGFAMRRRRDEKLAT